MVILVITASLRERKQRAAGNVQREVICFICVGLLDKDTFVVQVHVAIGLRRFDLVCLYFMK